VFGGIKVQAMVFVIGPKDGGQSSEKELVARLRKFVENTDLSFYKIASRNWNLWRDLESDDYGTFSSYRFF
jgi:hypothetical protein